MSAEDIVWGSFHFWHGVTNFDVHVGDISDHVMVIVNHS